MPVVKFLVYLDLDQNSSFLDENYLDIRARMESEQKKAIVSVRDKIDVIDTQILSLLKERLSCAKEIGKLKDGEKKSEMGSSS